MTEARKSSVESSLTRYHASSPETPAAVCPECGGDNGHNMGCIRSKRPKPYNYADYPETGYEHTEPKDPYKRKTPAAMDENSTSEFTDALGTLMLQNGHDLSPSKPEDTSGQTTDIWPSRLHSK